MRPLELRLRNFRSYFGDDAVFDLRHRGLVGVVGPIGSGKSSLLDAIAFALFGRTPTVAASTKALIHQRAPGATVSLRFAVEGEIWEVTRALRRKGQSVHGLQRLDGDTAEAAVVDSVVLESEVNEKIVELLGLEFDGFSRSVMLAQGRFAEFLRSRPAERDRVLKGVFGHDRIDAMRATAKERAAAAATEAATLAVRLEAADSLARRIAEATESVTESEARLELLQKAEPQFVDFAERAAATARIVAHAAGRLDELEPLAERIPAAAAVAEIVGLSTGAAAARKRLGTALEEAQQRLQAAEAELADLDPAAVRGLLDQASHLEGKIQQLDASRESSRQRHAAVAKRAADAAARVDTFDGEAGVAAATLQQLEQAQRAAAEAHRSATAEVHAAQHGDMAGALRAGLEPGEPCPVCEQPVATVPPPASPAAATAEAALAAAAAALEAAEERLKAGREAAETARVATGSARAESAAAAEELKTAEAQVEQAVAELAAARTELAALVGPRPPDELRRRLADGEEAVAGARKRVDVARAEHDEAIRSAQAADKELGSLRLALAELATRLGVELQPTEEAKAVAAAAEEIRTAWADTTETLTTARVAAEREAAEVAAAERELRLELNIAEDFASALAQTSGAIELQRAQIASLQAELAESTGLQAERIAALSRQETFEKLSSELTDSKFVRFLLDEEKRELAELGSDHFERLSSGRYRFSSDGEFHVVDLTSADAVRKADSLSGGETFLASLALALALAEMVARTGGRLDAFFLDEGFGSLDPEHLDLAMEGIERLAAGAAGRLVLVVSHVTEMRHRLEDLIELDRDPVTGDTIVVRS